MFDSEVTKAEKAVTSLDAKKADLERKHSEAGQRRAALDGQRQTFLTRIADGDDSARRDLRELDSKKQALAEDTEAFVASATDVGTKLGTAKKALARAEREQAIAQLEAQMKNVSGLDNGLENAVAQVREKTDILIAAVTGVAKLLEGMDSVRFDSRYGAALVARVREVVWNRFEELAMPSQTPRPTFSERVSLDFRRAIAQLKYMGLETITPGRGEYVYRSLCAIPGLRDIDLLPGQLIPLRPDEAVQLLRDGSVELVKEPETQPAGQEVVAE